MADPGTGVAAYSSGSGGWGVYGGTSAAAPIVAGVFALTGGAAAPASYAYQNPGLFHDITSGGNGPCSLLYLCNAGIGFDGPTGIGTPGATGGSSTQSSSPVPTPTATLPSVKISRSTVRASRSGRLRVRVSCPAGSPCSGKLVLRARGSGRVTRAIAERGFYVGAGKTATLTVRLSKRVRALLAHSHKLRVSAAASSFDTAHSSAAATFQLRAPLGRKHSNS